MSNERASKETRLKTQPKPAAPTVEQDDPVSSSSFDLTPENVLHLQKTIGNQAVQRLVANDSVIQRDEGGLRWKPTSENQLHLDPEIEAQIRMIQFAQAQLQFQNIQTAIQNLNLNLTALPAGSSASTSAPPASVSGPPTPAPAPLVPPGKGPDEPKPAGAGDVMKAVVKIPAVEQAIVKLQTDASDQIKRDWRKLSTGEKIGVIGVTASIAGLSLAGISTDPAARDFMFGQLQGKDYPVPGVKGLSFKFNLVGEEKSFNLTLDLMQFLPPSMK